MKREKIEGNGSVSQETHPKGNILLWKDKAKTRGIQINNLEKQLKATRASRDNYRLECKALKKQLKKEQTTGSKKEDERSCKLSHGEKAHRHQYSLLVIALFLILQEYGGMSLRGCRHSLISMVVVLGYEVRIPSHNSIRTWLCKTGYHRIRQQKSIKGNYVLYIDESIVIGSEKILLILGVPCNSIPEGRALCHEDMEVLFVGASQEWKSEQIVEKVKEITENKVIKYVVSDEGLNLRGAYKILNYSHIEDCTHIFANYLKKIYEKDDDFIAFCQLIGRLRQAWNLSKQNSQYMPPTMRGKLRFANIFPCVRWAQKQIQNWDKLPPDVKENLLFLTQKQEFLNGLGICAQAFSTTCAALKNNRYGENIHLQINTFLLSLPSHQTAQRFTQNCMLYLDNLQNKRILLDQEFLLCSSDIIESYFGKFKHKINPNNKNRMTEFIFTIANFSKRFSLNEIKIALETVSLQQLKKKL